MRHLPAFFKVAVIVLIVVVCRLAFPWLMSHVEFGLGMLFANIVFAIWYRTQHGYWPLDKPPA
jgi:hypothetical protein